MACIDHAFSIGAFDPGVDATDDEVSQMCVYSTIVILHRCTQVIEAGLLFGRCRRHLTIMRSIVQAASLYHLGAAVRRAIGHLLVLSVSVGSMVEHRGQR